MLDIQSFDHVDNQVYYNPELYLDMDQYIEIKEIIFNQLQNFNNLGQDLLVDLADNNIIKNKIYNDIIDYSKENYINIIETDYYLNQTHLEKVGKTVYSFLCVDFINVILPKIFENLNILSLEQYNLIIYKKYAQDLNFIKKQILLVIGDITQNLLKLQELDPTVVNDKSYKELIGKYGYYLELIDFSNSNNFLENYLNPVVNKTFNQIIWRTI